MYDEGRHILVWCVLYVCIYIHGGGTVVLRLVKLIYPACLCSQGCPLLMYPISCLQFSTAFFTVSAGSCLGIFNDVIFMTSLFTSHLGVNTSWFQLGKVDTGAN